MLVELAIVALSLPPLLRLRAFFLNQLRRDLVLAASVSEVIDGAYSADGRPLAVAGVIVAVLADKSTEELLDACLGFGDGLCGSAASATGSIWGVGMGVTSVEGVTSTSSASRYHFRRRV